MPFNKNLPERSPQWDAPDIVAQNRERCEAHQKAIGNKQIQTLIKTISLS